MMVDNTDALQAYLDQQAVKRKKAEEARLNDAEAKRHRDLKRQQIEKRWEEMQIKFRLATASVNERLTPEGTHLRLATSAYDTNVAALSAYGVFRGSNVLGTIRIAVTFEEMVIVDHCKPVPLSDLEQDPTEILSKLLSDAVVPILINSEK